MLIKVLTVECTKCHACFEVGDCESEFEEWVERESCPNCMKLVAEAL